MKQLLVVLGVSTCIYGYAALALAGVGGATTLQGLGGQAAVTTATNQPARIWPPRVDVHQSRLERTVGLARAGVRSISRTSMQMWRGRQLTRFDSDEALQCWRGSGARIQRSQPRSSEAPDSGRIVFEGGRRIPHISLELGALARQELWDWEEFHGLVLHLRKETPEAGVIFVQVEDVHGGRIRQVVSVSNEQPQRVALSLDQVRQQVDLRHVARVRFYQWKPEDSSAWYIDDISLVQTDDRF